MLYMECVRLTTFVCTICFVCRIFSLPPLSPPSFANFLPIDIKSDQRQSLHSTVSHLCSKLNVNWQRTNGAFASSSFFYFFS